MSIALFLSLLVRLFGAEPFPENAVLSLFPVSVDASVAEGHVALAVPSDARDFGELTRRHVAARAKDGRVVVALGGYPRSNDRVTPQHRRCSFVIDCDEPSVLEVAALAERDLGPTGPMALLVAWVNRYITTKTYGRSFDVASVVATRREGDCTEHAVLLAALARSRKIPARVVLGLALVDGPGKTIAVGHAWVEYHDGKRWLPADAALAPGEGASPAGAPPLTVRYLPIQLLAREDAGFHTSLLTGYDTKDVRAVYVHAFPPALSPAGRASLDWRSGRVR